MSSLSEWIQLQAERRCAFANLKDLSLLQKPKSALMKVKTASARLVEASSMAILTENSRTFSELEESKTLTL